MLLLAIGLLGAAILLIVLYVGSVVAERAEARESLKQLEGYQIQDSRDREMLEGFTDRVARPLGEIISRLGARFTPEGYVEQIEEKLLYAGNPPSLTTDRVLIYKVLGAASVVVWAPLLLLLLGLSGLLGLIAVGLLWFGSFMATDAILNRMVEERKHQLAIRLPDLLDLMVISVEAGLGFDQALDRTTKAIPGDLSDEFRRVLRETRIGSSRSDALRAMDERTHVPELHTFILAMLQADTFGVSVARVLRSQAADMRVMRRFRAQEEAQKAPVKMLFPLVFCIFPAVFVVILGPAVIRLLDAL
ncbi:MAG: type II secretion system F family protein [Acidimicrobiia bacterium]|nr:type II secretion system F family protein [Acidimicrobiia bacterium]